MGGPVGVVWMKITMFGNNCIDIELSDTVVLIWSDGMSWWFDEWVKYPDDESEENWELLR